MKTQRRFTSSLDLNTELLKLKRQAADQLRLAGQHETKMKKHWDRANSGELDSHASEYARQKGFDEKKLMERNLKLHRRITEVKMPKLKQAMAAFGTKTFEFSKDDNGVVLSHL